jgi:curved DNA-binding protein CbpA
MIALLGNIARRGHSGVLHLDRSRAGEAATLRFAHGLLAGFTPPSSSTQPGDNATDALSALRHRIVQAALEAARETGASPDFVATPEGGRSLPAGVGAGGLNASDIAIDLCRRIEDLSWLEEPIRGARAEPFRTASPPPAVQPYAALGAAEGFLLSRADGSLTLQQVLDTSPLGESETVRALGILRAVGMLFGGEPLPAAGAHAEAPAKIRHLSDLDLFLEKTSGTTAAGPSTTGPAPAQGAGPGGYTAEQQKERDLLMQRCHETAGQDHYLVLGVDRGADEPMIRHAYYRLARKYHPDKLVKPHLEDIHRELEGMFAVFTEAYNTLTDPATRALHDREMDARTPGRRKESGLDKHATGRDSYLRGRKEMEAGRIFEAMRLFENAVENDGGRAEYFHYLGLCQGQNPRWRKKAEESFLKAVEMNPAAVLSLLELARLYRKGGLDRKSCEMYERVLTWDPTNEESLVALGRAPAGGSDAPPTGRRRSFFKKD